MLGRFWKVKGPGFFLLIPAIQQMVRIDLRTVVMDVPPQDVITRDNVSVKVNAVVYFRIVDAAKAVIQVENYYQATSQLAQTTLRAVLGKHELDDLLSEREKLNLDIQQVLDNQTAAWGIKVSTVEMKDVDLNESMIRAIARQAEAERERRAKIIHAEGELQASEKLLQAAQMLSRQPQAMQLRYLQTLANIAGDKSSIIVFRCRSICSARWPPACARIADRLINYKAVKISANSARLSEARLHRALPAGHGRRRLLAEEASTYAHVPYVRSLRERSKRSAEVPSVSISPP
jgi:regulator of protease activity HflC (stomatin/prohibitin superfamily)